MNVSNNKYYFNRNGNFWGTTPFLKFLIPYCMGIVFYKSLGFEISTITFCVIISTLFILSFQIKRSTYLPSKQVSIFGFLFFIFLIITGVFVSKSSDPRQVHLDITNNYQSANYLYGKIDKSWKTKTSARFLFELTSIKETDNWKPSSGHVMMISKDSNFFSIGDELIVKNGTKEITKPDKEYLIDYSSYYKNQGVFLQQFTKTNDLILVEKDKSTSFWIYSQFINSKFETILSENLDTLSFGIFNALILGDKGGLDQETKTKFSEGGIMHILAVSGLHVGILFFILHSIFGFIKKLKRGKALYYVIMLLALWGYALIAGWSNSVVRATLMFSLFLIAEVINRKHYPLNTAAFSAFLILTFNPNALYQISFQLSYAAVFAIILLYDKFYNLVSIDNKNMDYLWKIICVSMAAQIGTFPITLYYFKIFQPAFLVFNLVAIPLAFILLISGFTLITISPVKEASGFFGKILDMIIYLFDSLIGIMNSISPAFQNIQISLFQVFLLYAMIFTISAFLYYRKLSYYLILLLIVSVYFGLEIQNQWASKNQSGVEIFNKNKLIVYEGEDFFVHDASMKLKKNNSIESFINYYQLENLRTLKSYSSLQFDLIISGKKQILIVKDLHFKIPKNLHFDIIIVNNKLTPKQLGYFNSFTENLNTYH